ncbi:hypothetical protein AJ79_07010 [Helicocarpus griseus UAMH5409]|uniref:Uncharacterized protein n=1 Tax=Helicocarpus griseus UAMH5409 TaxID=1447875 RepID=A0A2B7X7I9_9EURO|nr:hypothetical protein AJ79_07010 [Helicocarpus griseus UAMH5409]
MAGDGRDSLDIGNSTDGVELGLRFISSTTVSSHHLRYSSASSVNPLLGSPSSTLVGSPSSKQLPLGYKLRRFWTRTIASIIVPSMVTGYYAFLVKYYLESQDEDVNILKVGPAGANFAFWSWFIICVFGLNASKYGLTGTEAVILMYSQSLAPKDALQLMMHADRTWSGPSGWLKILRKFFFLWKKHGSSRHNVGGHTPSLLWFILLFLSALPLAALPISGLCMEPGDGYIVQKSGPSKPTVLGRNQTNFDHRSQFSFAGIAGSNWKNAMPVRIAGIGVMYTKPDLKRSDYDFLQKFPNAFPPDSGIPEIFLTPQAPVPVSGTTSGIVIRYNCSSVSKVSDFTILNRFHERGNNSIPPYVKDTNTTFPNPHKRKIDDDTIQLVNYRSPDVENYEAVIEIANTGDKGTVPTRYHSANKPAPRWGLEKDFVSEYILYQYLEHPIPRSANKRGIWKPYGIDKLEMGIDESIPDILGRYRTLYHPADKANSTEHPMKVVVGIRCTSASDFGIADIDSRFNTFTNFVSHDVLPAPNISFPLGAISFSAGVANIMSMALAEHDDRSSISLGPQNIISSVGGRPYTVDDVVSSYIQSRQLKNSILQAYASYALDLAYDGVVNSSGASSTEFDSRSFFRHENLTATIPGKVLTRGPLKKIYFPLYLLVPWAVGSVVLSLIYSHRPRWSETFDGYSLFRFGADYADRVKDRHEFTSTEDYENCEALKTIPGFIGDARPFFTPGHISLVEKCRADMDKLYMRDLGVHPGLRRRSICHSGSA